MLADLLVTCVTAVCNKVFQILLMQNQGSLIIMNLFYIIDVRPVSYTHLDVYKRQCPGFPSGRITLLYLVSLSFLANILDYKAFHRSINNC